MGPTHKSGKSWGELVTLFDRYCDDVMSFAIGVHHTIAYPGQAGLFDNYSDYGVIFVIGVQHTIGKSRGELMTLFDRYWDDGVSAAIGVQHTMANPWAKW